MKTTATVAVNAPADLGWDVLDVGPRGGMGVPTGLLMRRMTKRYLAMEAQGLNAPADMQSPDIRRNPWRILSSLR